MTNDDQSHIDSTSNHANNETSSEQIQVTPETQDTKHPLDWILGGVAGVSVILNIVQFFWQARGEAIKYPGPLVYRMTIPATDGGLFANALDVEKDVFLEQYPKPKIFNSRALRNARKAINDMDRLALRESLWHFLVIRNVTDHAYTSVQFIRGDKVVEDIGTIDAKSTCFVYYSLGMDLDSVVRYTIHGTADRLDSLIPVKAAGQFHLPFLTVASGMKLWGSLEGFDKSNRLYEFRMSERYDLPAED